MLFLKQGRKQQSIILFRSPRVSLPFCILLLLRNGAREGGDEEDREQNKQASDFLKEKKWDFKEGL